MSFGGRIAGTQQGRHARRIDEGEAPDVHGE
jgi:hypothetical protein